MMRERVVTIGEERRMVGILTEPEVKDDACFTGFDAYQKLLAREDVNYVILACPPHFRPKHFEAAVEAGKHVFMEKPIAVDATGVRTVLEAGKLATQKGLAPT